MVKLVRESNRTELKKIKDKIYSDPIVKKMTSHIFYDRGDWGPFKACIDAIKNSSPYITGVYYEDDPHYRNGYRWENDRMTGKMRNITIETDFGDLEGSLNCYGAGSVEDPMESYDMVLNIWSV